VLAADPAAATGSVGRLAVDVAQVVNVVVEPGSQVGPRVLAAHDERPRAEAIVSVAAINSGRRGRIARLQGRRDLRVPVGVALEQLRVDLLHGTVKRGLLATADFNLPGDGDFVRGSDGRGEDLKLTLLLDKAQRCHKDGLSNVRQRRGGRAQGSW